jgi:hypothetical protein
MIRYPNPNASPRVRYTDLELDSYQTLGNGGRGTTTMGLGVGMGEPPVRESWFQ